MSEFERLTEELSIIYKYIEVEKLKISEGVGDEITLHQLKIKYFETCGKLLNIKL